MEPQNFSVNDGNGIRTIIFFAGCPLSCRWCSNPEGYTASYKVAYYERTCIQCGRCTSGCPEGIGINLNEPERRLRCKACGACAETCPTKSRKSLVHCYSSRELLKLIEKQKLFYRFSGGGVTFSGGEATMQADILRELAFALYDQGVDLAIETSGYFYFDEVKDILQKMGLIFMDIKHMDDEKHRLHTGVSNKRILENIKRLGELEVPVVVRIPLIEGVNSDRENIRRTAEFVKASISYPKLELLPYHLFGDSKYEALGMETPPREFSAPDREYIEELAGVVKNAGVEVVSYK